MNEEGRTEDPRLTLARMLADGKWSEKIHRASGELAIHPVRLWLLAAGWPWPIPRGGLVSEIVRSAVMAKWQVIPSGIAAPVSGDLAVYTNKSRIPEDIGIVQQVHTEMRFWKVMLQGKLIKKEEVDADFWLRVPG